jgi:hypothetical protein
MATTLPEHWATTDAVLELLAKIMKEPIGDHSAAVHAELDGPLLEVHVAVIFRLLAKKQPQLSAVWEGVNHRDVGVALHAVIYHLLGGAATTLLPPPSGGTAGRACRHGYTIESGRNKGYFASLSRAKVKKDESLLLRLRSTAFDPSSHANLNVQTAAPAAVASGGGGGGGGGDDDPALQERGERRRCVTMVLLCGTLPKNFSSPFRAFGDGNIDLLRYVANLSVEGNSDWVPRPQPAEVQQLRRLTWVQHVDLQMRDEALGAQKVELDAALRMLMQGERREVAGREWTELHVQKLGAIHGSVIASLRAVIAELRGDNRKLRAEVRHERDSNPQPSVL